MKFQCSRRVWVKRFVLGTVASISGPRWVETLLAEVTDGMPNEAFLRLKVANYPGLVGVGGSIQLMFNEVMKPITLNRVSRQEFVALDSICTHVGCTVGAFDLGANCMTCPCHGSRYDLEGRVFRDGNGISTEPAANDLNRFETSFDEATEVITVRIPGLALAIGSIQAFPQAGSGETRVQLRFPATARSTYEISHQPDLSGEPIAVPVATAPGGALQNSITPVTTGQVTAYLNAAGPRGFYLVGLRLEPL